jgi:hypothetical protein
MTNPPPSGRGSNAGVKRFFGGLLMAIGILIGGLSGLCTAMFLNLGGGPNDGGMLGLVLILGVPPIVLGVAMFFGGLAVWRSARPPPIDPAKFD